MNSDNECTMEPTYRSRVIAQLPKLKILDGPHVTKKERIAAGHSVDEWEDGSDVDDEEDNQEEKATVGEVVEIKSFNEISHGSEALLADAKNRLQERRLKLQERSKARMNELAADFEARISSEDRTTSHSTRQPPSEAKQEAARRSDIS